MIIMYYLLIGIVMAMVILLRNEVMNGIINMAKFIILKCNGNDEYKTQKDIQDALDDGRNMGYNIVNKYGNNSRIVLFLAIMLIWPMIVLGMMVLLLAYLYCKNK